MAKKYNRSKNKKDYEKEEERVDANGVQQNPENKKNNSKPYSKPGKPNNRGKKDWNDASDFIPDETLRSQAASYPITPFLGVELERKVNNVAAKEKFATIMGIRVNPSPGVTKMGLQGNPLASGCNQMGRKWYTKYSAFSNKPTNYTPEDISIANLAVGELISMIEFAKRAYGIAFNYNIRNRDIPRQLLSAMHIDPDSLLNNLSQFRMRLNKILVTASAIPWPEDVKWFKICRDIYAHVFVDETSPMAQYFVISPLTTWILDETYSQSGSGLVTTRLDNNTVTDANIGTLKSYTFTADQLLDTIENMVDALLSSATLNFVYADILHYHDKFGGNLVQFGYVPEMFIVAPEFSEEFLTQVHNMTLMNFPVSKANAHGVHATNFNDVVGDVNTLSMKYCPEFQAHNQISETLYAFDQIVDFPFTPNPTVDDKVNAVRFTSSVGNILGTGTGSYTDLNRLSLVDHWVSCLEVFSCGSSVLVLDDQSFIETASNYNQVIYLSHFRHHPALYFLDANGVFQGSIFEINFFTIIEQETLDRLIDLKMYGLFDTVLGK